jgi:hypothetical protein
VQTVEVAFGGSGIAVRNPPKKNPRKKISSARGAATTIRNPAATAARGPRSTPSSSATSIFSGWASSVEKAAAKRR